MIRAATFSDIPNLCRLITELYGRSVYAGRATLDVPQFKGLCMGAIRSHGAGGCLFVADHGAGAVGFIMGASERLYGISKERYATDLFTYVGDGGRAGDATGLIVAFLRWARKAPGVIEIQMGVSDAAGDHLRSGRMLERAGMKKFGEIYVLRLDGLAAGREGEKCLAS